VLDHEFELPFLYYVEHSGMVVTRSVELGLNTNAFDKNSYRRITTRPNRLL
jgi:hypothetical protein